MPPVLEFIEAEDLRRPVGDRASRCTNRSAIPQKNRRVPSRWMPCARGAGCSWTTSRVGPMSFMRAWASGGSLTIFIVFPRRE